MQLSELHATCQLTPPEQDGPVHTLHLGHGMLTINGTLHYAFGTVKEHLPALLTLCQERQVPVKTRKFPRKGRRE